MRLNMRRMSTVLAVSAILLSCFFPAGDAGAWSQRKVERALGRGDALPLSAAEIQSIAGNIGNFLSGRYALGKHAGHVASGAVHGIRRDPATGTPFHIDGDALKHMTGRMGKIAAGAIPSETALSFIETNGIEFGLDNPRRELVVATVVSDDNGLSHVRFDQVYQGIPVRGNSIVIHLDAYGTPYSMNGRYAPTPSEIDVDDIRITRDKALEIASDNLQTLTDIADLPDAISVLLGYEGPDAELCIRHDDAGTPRLAWHVVVRPDAMSFWNLFVDARTGAMFEKYDESGRVSPANATAAGVNGVIFTLNVSFDNGMYYLYDIDADIYTYDAHGKVVSASNYPTLVKSTNNQWSDPVAVSAHGNARVVYEYYLDEHGRDGLDGRGGAIKTVVHYTIDGKPLDNAFWNGSFIAFGDAQPYAGALDVVAHELTHGVVEKTVGLEYKFQSGALNEAFCDIMAVMVDDDDWEIAEDIPNGPIRDVSSPGRFGLPGHMSEYYDLRLDQDYGGVHINMGIPSRAAYLVAEAIGRRKTADIWYRVLHNLYLTPKSQFVDMRLAAIRSAKDLFGDNSAEAAAVADAFDSVGIEDAAPTVPPANTTPVAGDEYIAFVYENGPHGSLALASPDADSNNDFMYPTNTYVFTDGSSPVTVCRNGSFLMFVDESSNIRKIDLATMEEAVIEYSGIWSSIKLSPDGCRLAATTINADSTIYVIDLDIPENSKAIHLYTASTEGVKSRTAVMADALDWDATSTHILYDAFHSLPVAGGSPIEFWDVNLLDVETGIITRIATPTDNGTQVGNPSFAETNDRYIVCDMFSTIENRNSMIAIDLYTNELKELRNNGMVMTGIPNLGHPKYSPDDSSVIFQQYSLSYRRFIVYTMPIQHDRMTADGMVKAFAFGYLPDWFVLGMEEQPTHAEEDSSPEFIKLSQNTPNPFNPSTTIPFSVGESGLVRIRVYDALGRTVATLVEDVMPAGNHSVRFDGKDCASGVYFCRLETGGKSRHIRMLLVK